MTSFLSVIEFPPVFYAAAGSSPEPLKWLIGQGANIFATDRQQKTPLDFAVEAGRAANIALRKRA